MQQSSESATDRPPSPLVRHLGLIKALAIVMAVMIVAALVVIVVTIYSRLQAGSANRGPSEMTISLPVGAVVSAASADAKGMVLVVDIEDGQQIRRLSAGGKVTRKIILQSE